MEMTIFYSNIDRFGNNLLIRGFENGKRFNRKHKFYPTFHVPDPSGDWQSLDGRTLGQMKPGSMHDCKDFIDKYSDVTNFGVYGTTNYVHQFISETFPGKIKYDRTKLNICTIDIEVGSEDGFPEPRDAKHEIITITIKDNNKSLYHTWGSYDFDSDKCEQDVFYHRCRDEKDLLLSFLEYWSFHIPDIITGWYSDFFDIPYLVNRIARVLGEGCVYSLSPWRKINGGKSQKYTLKARPEGTDDIIGGEETYDIVGISQLDYINLFKKFTLNTLGQQESYKLDHIANVVLGEKKLDYSEYGSLHMLYKSDYQKFVEYNIKDVELVDRIEEKLGLIDLVLTMAYRAKCTLNETLGTVGIWDAILYNEFKRRKIAVPQKKTSSYNTIEGGHVKDPQVGSHEWVVSFDLNSLYPHLIMQYNMSPETVVNDIRRNTTIDELLELCSENKDANIPDDRCLTATGQLFRNDVEGIIPQIIQEYYDERVQIKKQMLDAKQRYEKDKTKAIEREISILDNNQMAIKIAMNSFYGALANKYFRYFDVRVAEAITVSGQFTIRWAEKILNNYLNKILKTDTDYVIAIDTDSVYLNLGPFVDKVMPGETDKNKIVNFLDKASAQIEKHLDKGYTQLASFMQAPRQKMVMAREIIADKAVWTAKKRYIAHVWDSEGVRYAEPKLKVTGVEAVRSSTPQVCRELITNTLKKIVTSSESEVQKHIEELRVEYMKLSPEDIAFPRGVSEMEKWADAASLYKKGTPIHVRAALLYNDQLNKNKLSSRYERIMSGNKMKFLYMKMPNPLHENVFGFVNVLPKELDLAQYIDYNKQFEKSFLDPIQIILDAMGWNAEKQNNLEDFFG
jgi:DNA polymerase elongation subunit (family B)